MTEVPIIDAAIIAALRAALPWEPPAEVLEAMAKALCDTITGSANSVWDSPLTDRQYRMDQQLAAYRGQPIMRELYDSEGGSAMMADPALWRRHVVPLGDVREHEASLACWCGPVCDGDGVVVHRALDGRERREDVAALQGGEAG